MCHACRLLAVAAMIALAGCGGRYAPGVKDPVDLATIPEPVMKTVKEKLPADVTLTGAWRRANGDYEVRGKLKSGKVVEVEVKPDGTFVEME